MVAIKRSAGVFFDNSCYAGNRVFDVAHRFGTKSVVGLFQGGVIGSGRSFVGDPEKRVCNLVLSVCEESIKALRRKIMLSQSPSFKRPLVQR